MQLPWATQQGMMTTTVEQNDNEIWVCTGKSGSRNLASSPKRTEILKSEADDTYRTAGMGILDKQEEPRPQRPPLDA